MTPGDLVQAAAGKNRAMAFGFAGFVIAVFAAAIAVGIVGRMLG